MACLFTSCGAFRSPANRSTASRARGPRGRFRLAVDLRFPVQHRLVSPAFRRRIGRFRLSLNGEGRDKQHNVVTTAAGRIPIIAGVSAADPEDSFALAERARDVEAGAVLVQPNEAIRADRDRLVAFLSRLADRGGLPIVLQDLDWAGPGLAMVWIDFVLQRVEAVREIKMETVPAGPKYSAIKAAFGERVHLSGGWAVTQMIDGLDRGLDGGGRVHAGDEHGGDLSKNLGSAPSGRSRRGPGIVLNDWPRYCCFPISTSTFRFSFSNACSKLAGSFRRRGGEAIG